MVPEHSAAWIEGICLNFPDQEVVNPTTQEGGRDGPKLTKPVKLNPTPPGVESKVTGYNPTPPGGRLEVTRVREAMDENINPTHPGVTEELMEVNPTPPVVNRKEVTMCRCLHPDWDGPLCPLVIGLTEFEEMDTEEIFNPTPPQVTKFNPTQPVIEMEVEVTSEQEGYESKDMELDVSPTQPEVTEEMEVNPTLPVGANEEVKRCTCLHPDLSLIHI